MSSDPPPALDGNDWADRSQNFLSPDRIAKIKAALAAQPIILEHRFYYGSRAPDRLVFDDFDEVQEYIATKVSPGDALWVWGYTDLCRDDNDIAHGKAPDAHGRTPKGGAY
ncbi:MAG: hypothetical protein SGI91_08645 [Alphaproteobacteria bacterium]|nr:hypothetical protein [Alphaproteobacteria bacterium]